LEFFESVLDIAKAKSEIFEKGAEYAIIPSDSPYTDFLKNKAIDCGIKNIISFGSCENSNASVVSCNYSENSTNVCAKILEKSICYQLNSNNDSYVINSLASILAAHIISGIDLQILADSMSSFVIQEGRGGVIRFQSPDVILIDDSYNASPTAMRSAIRSLGNFGNRRKILAIGDMWELGAAAVYFHENLSATIDKYGIDLVFSCGEFSKYLHDNLSEQKKGDWRENSHELADCILKELRDGDCILVKGSNSMNMNYIVDAIKKSILG
jgi:UDP-N-acetylmuramoyl-tripeptide--D-alanyl-D-alanine ligase